MVAAKGGGQVGKLGKVEKGADFGDRSDLGTRGTAC